MWSYQTRSFINPLPGYVEGKAGDPKVFPPRRTRPTLGVSILMPRLRAWMCLETAGNARTAQVPEALPATQVLAIVPGPGDAGEAFSRVAAPTRLL